MPGDVVQGRSTRASARIRSGVARGIGGLSEGGYGAINIAIHHPGEFGLVEGWSRYETADDIPSIFQRRQSLLTWNTPLDTLPGVAPAPAVGTQRSSWLYTGSDDQFLQQNESFGLELERAQIPYRLRIVRGGHNWALWRGNAADSYLAASRHLRNVA